MPVWKRVCSGAYIDLLELTSDDVTLDDMVTALSRQLRFDGHGMLEPLSIMQHQMLALALIAPTASPADKLAALIHDAHEYLIGDMGTPTKILTGAQEPKYIKRAVRDALHPNWADVNYSLVKDADLFALEVERKAMWPVEPGDSRYWPPEEGINTTNATLLYREYKKVSPDTYKSMWRHYYELAR